MMPSLSQQITYLFLLALAISCIAWTVTHEEVFREPREFCVKRSKEGKTLFIRKFFDLFTCEYGRIFKRLCCRSLVSERTYCSLSGRRFYQRMENGEQFILTAGMTYVVSDNLSSHRSVTSNGVKLLIIDGDFLK